MLFQQVTGWGARISLCSVTHRCSYGGCISLRVSSSLCTASPQFFFHLQFLVNFFPIASFVSSHHIHFHYRWQKESFHSFHWVYIWMSSRSMIICFCLTVSLICQFTFCFYFTFNVMTLKLFAASITSIYYLLLLNAINSYSSFCSVRLIMFSSLSSWANSDVNLCLANNGCLSYAAH